MTDHKDLIELAYAQADNLEAYFREYHTVPILEISVHTIRHLADAIEAATAEREEDLTIAYMAGARDAEKKARLQRDDIWAEIYRKGQEDMRERAALICRDAIFDDPIDSTERFRNRALTGCEVKIRSLPIKEKDDDQS